MDPRQNPNSKTGWILITGGSGLIGQSLVHELSPDFPVAVLDVKKPAALPVGAVWQNCDLTKTESVESSLAQLEQRLGPNIASVIHLAAYYDFSGEPSKLYKELTVEGSRRLMRGLQRFKVEQFIFSSSLLVMKPSDDSALDESSATRAEWDYPRSKIAAEEVLRAEHNDIPLVVLRIAGVYDDMCHSLPLSQHMRRIYEKRFESFFFPGDSSSGQPFIHLEDLTNCIGTVVEKRRELAAEELFLIAEPEVVSYEELQDRLGELIHGREWPTIRVPKELSKLGARVQNAMSAEEQFIKPWMIDLADDNYPVSIERARKRLGWEAEIRLSEKLPELVQNLKRDPRQWYAANNLPLPASWSGEQDGADQVGSASGQA